MLAYYRRGLHVGVSPLRTIFARSIASFHDVYKFATAVVPPPWVPFAYL
jgi:hypothetical protein